MRRYWARAGVKRSSLAVIGLVRRAKVGHRLAGLGDTLQGEGSGLDDEEQLVMTCNEWVASLGLPEGQTQLEIIDEATRAPLAILGLAWPAGLQEGYSQPVALLLDESPEVEEAANRAGYLFFTDLASFRAYVERTILALEPAAV